MRRFRNLKMTSFKIEYLKLFFLSLLIVITTYSALQKFTSLTSYFENDNINSNSNNTPKYKINPNYQLCIQYETQQSIDKCKEIVNNNIGLVNSKCSGYIQQFIKCRDSRHKECMKSSIDNVEGCANSVWLSLLQKEIPKTN
jgi:hypothetical protein